jgi:hypothetical protein
MQRTPRQLHASIYLKKYYCKINKRKIKNICNTYIDRAISDYDLNQLVNKLYEELNKGVI